jgi:peroxiredoxin
MKMTENGPEAVDSETFFQGRRVALFSVPGAFTPTCSAKHLPGFIEKADELKARGIDEIACTAVNDAFVMGAWGKSAGADGKVTMLADGNGDFAKAVGLEMDGSKFGMGSRGQRYSVVVNDGVVEQVNIEGPGEFRVSWPITCSASSRIRRGQRPQPRHRRRTRCFLSTVGGGAADSDHRLSRERGASRSRGTRGGRLRLSRASAAL